MSTQAPVGLPPSSIVDGWVERGLITADQGEALRADLAARAPEQLAAQGGPAEAVAPKPRTGSLVTEALGYLGGVVIFVAGALVAGQLWDELSDGARIGLVFAVAALLLGAGLAVPARLGPPGVRLRSVLWAGSAVAVAFGFGLVAEAWTDLRDEEAIAFACLLAAGYAAALWFAHRQALQQLATLGLLALGLATAVSALESDRIGGDEYVPAAAVAVWGLGLAWALLAWGGLLPPRRVGMLGGSAVALVATLTMFGSDAGAVIQLATVLALVAAAVWLRDLPLLGLVSVGALILLPMVVRQFFPGELSAAFALLVVGVALVLTAVFTARRARVEKEQEARDADAGEARDLRDGSRPLALGAAALVAAGAGVAVAVLVG